ncbi:MAG: S-methyl-5'-thioinosine phosphorylase [Proteobacteria bacterium]|jgi:5'-deoxy-5'-methylthioadenosine phosphorylase|nr:S-methyl-5'-thioinosine phosphorylase [Pseudomonadota bacterium]MCG6935069.1 S-methyl-5'-thioinosine phosphorylase [Pseudomonadota bacterium]
MNMTSVAIIGGTGLAALHGLEITHREIMQTPFGEPSGILTRGRYCGHDVMFLPRHGAGHNIPPHKVNYRANIWVLKEAGVKNVIAVNAVGGIHADMSPGCLVIPDQIIDYTWSRTNTFFEDSLSTVVHVDFTEPYCEVVRQHLIKGARKADLALIDQATYGATQGPRLETAAEVDRLERDGCDIVGMTGMPEAVLARELDLCYASVSLVVNRAAGRGTGAITMEEIEQNLNSGMQQVRRLLEYTIPLI